MSDQRLEREAQAHIALAKLLRRARPQELQSAVQKVIDSDLSTDAKIAKIRRLDSVSDDELTVESEGSGGSGPPSETSQWLPLRFPFRKLKNIIKLPHADTPFFTYLTLERRKIKEFGRKAHILAQTILLPRIRLDKTISTFLSTSLQEWADSLVDLLEPVSETGWRLLSKRDYNMVMTLMKLCIEICAINFKILNYRDRYLIDKLRNIETLFFVFHYHESFVDRTVEGVTRVLLADGEHDEEADKAEIFIRSILTQGYSIPSLYDLLLGLNMIKFRRAFTYTDLIATDLGELFNTTHFATGPKVQEEIQGTIANLRQSILTLEEQRRRIRRVKDYLPMRSTGEHDDTLLESFYDFGDSTLENAYGRDRENVVRFVPQVLRKLDEHFYPLLIGTVRVEKVGSVPIFSQSLFNPAIDQLRHLGFKIEQASFGYRSFAHSRYWRIQNEGKGTIPAEAEILRFLNETVAAFRELGNRIAAVLDQSQSIGEEGVVAIDELQLRVGGVILPFGSRKLTVRGFLRGRTVRQALEIFVSLCFLMARYLFDRDLMEINETEQVVGQKLDSELHAFARIAQESEYDEVIARVVVPDGPGPGAVLPSADRPGDPVE